MCRRTILFSIFAFFAGLLALAAGGYFGATRLMILEEESPLGFQETVDVITQTARDLGWQVPKVYRLCEGLAKHGHQVEPVAVIELCQPDYAASLLDHDATRMVSSFMPCRISVYRRADGKVTISRMNTAMMSHLFPKEVARVMARASADTEQIVAKLHARVDAG